MNLPHHFVATPVLQCLMGLLLLCLGRRLFWIFVGVIGFFAGAHFGQQMVSGQPESVLLLVAIVIGLFGAVLAVFLQRVAVAIAGGTAGGMLGIRLAAILGFADQTTHLAAFVVGAILAAVLISLLFDWALIVLSSLTGAVMVIEPLGLAQTMELTAFGALAIVGIVIQVRQLEGRRAEPT